MTNKQAINIHRTDDSSDSSNENDGHAIYGNESTDKCAKRKLNNDEEEVKSFQKKPRMTNKDNVQPVYKRNNKGSKKQQEKHEKSLAKRSKAKKCTESEEIEKEYDEVIGSRVVASQLTESNNQNETSSEDNDFECTTFRTPKNIVVRDNESMNDEDDDISNRMKNYEIEKPLNLKDRSETMNRKEDNEHNRNTTSLNSTSPDLASLSTQNALIKTLLETLKTSINENTKSVTDVVLSSVSEVSNRITKVEQDIHDIKVMCSSNIVSTNKNEKQKELDTELILFNKIFNNDFLEKVLLKCTLGHMDDHICKMVESRAVKNAINSLRTIMFAKQTDDKLDVYQTKIGKRFSTYRKGMVATAIIAANNSKAGSNPSHKSSQHESLEPPRWLKNGYIDEHHIEFARSKIEDGLKEKQAFEDKMKSVYSKEITAQQKHDLDVARHGASRLFSKFTNILNKAREASKNCFFEEVGYVFCQWGDTGVKEKNLDLTWMDDCSNPLDVNLSIIPETIEVSTREAAADKLRLSSVESQNSAIMCRMIKAHPEFILRVTHSVLVRSSSKDNDHDQADEKTLVTADKRIKKNINMIEVASKVLASFISRSRQYSISSVLSSNHSSLKIIYVLAVALRMLIELKIDEWKNGECNIGRRALHGFHFDCLMPGPSRQKKGLIAKLHLTEAALEKLGSIDGSQNDSKKHRSDNDAMAVGDNRETDERVSGRSNAASSSMDRIGGVYTI